MIQMIRWFSICILFASTALAADSKGAKDRLIIHFDKARATLTQTDRQKLRDFVEAIGATDKIDKIDLAVWGDLKYAAVDNDFASSNRGLAARRALQIRSFLDHEYSLHNVEIFNMADSTELITRALGTNESELKSVFAKEGLNPVTPSEYQKFQEKGEPGIAILTVRRK